MKHFYAAALIFIICLGTSSMVFSQTGNYKPQPLEETLNTGLGAYGETIVPVTILPGFVDGTPNSKQLNLPYPSFKKILGDDLGIDFNRRNLDFTDPAPPTTTKSSADFVDITILSSTIAQNSIFLESEQNFDFVAISDLVPISKIMVNGIEQKITANNIVEFSSAVKLEGGANQVLVEGELTNRNRFRKIYDVTLQGEPDKLSFLILRLSIDYDNNLNLASVKSFESTTLANIYDGTERKKDFLYNLGLTYYLILDDEYSFYATAFGNRPFSEDKKYGLLSLITGLEISKNKYTTNLYLAGVDTQDESFALVGGETNIDLNYSTDRHDGTIVSLGYNLRYATNGGYDGEKLGAGIFAGAKYNINYLWQWLNLMEYHLKVGQENYVTKDSIFNYVQAGTAWQLFKTAWVLDFGLDIAYRAYKYQQSAVSSIDRPLRKDTYISTFVRHTYHFTPSLDIFTEGSYGINLSNRNPYDRFIASVGFDYLF